MNSILSLVSDDVSFARKFLINWMSPAIVQAYFLLSLEEEHRAKGKLSPSFQGEALNNKTLGGKWILTRQLGRFELRGRAFKRKRGTGGKNKTVSELMTSLSHKTLRKEHGLQEFVEEVQSSDLYPLGCWQDTQEAWTSWKMTNRENWVGNILEAIKDWEEMNKVRELYA